MTKPKSPLWKSDKSAVGVIFALCLLPLVLFIALAIDFSFFTEARSQIQLAADAAATHAIRAATGTFALETASGTSFATATSDAITAGDLAGTDWFSSQLGQLPTAYVTLVTSSKTQTGNPNVQVSQTTSPPGFSATVGYTGIYPPFFKTLFGASANWTITGTSNAAAQYQYVEVLMMLDTSQSMLIGATTADILKMDQTTVCLPTKFGGPIDGDNQLYQVGLPYTTNTAQYGAAFNNGGLIYQYLPAHGSGNNAVASDQVDMSQLAPYGYTDPSGKPDDTSGSCKTGYYGDGYGNGSSPGVPCAFACHNANTTISVPNLSGANVTVYKDLYGNARRIGAQLRLDVVLSAAEQVVTDMISSEQASQQFSVGVYQFNGDSSVFDSGKTSGNTPTQGQGTANGDPNYEATYNLSGVLQTLKADDYAVTPGETNFPAYSTVDVGNTDFPTSIKDLIAGNSTNNTKLSPSGSGNSSTTPIKDIFIVTDGFNDTPPSHPGGRLMGPMEDYKTDDICGLLKTAEATPLNFTVYVLYVNFNPVPHLTYYLPVTTAEYASPSNSYVSADYPSIVNGSEQEYAEATSATGLTNDPPNVAALRACASPGDFYDANNTTDISTDMQEMLKSALAGAIKLTN